MAMIRILMDGQSDERSGVEAERRLTWQWAWRDDRQSPRNVKGLKRWLHRCVCVPGIAFFNFSWASSNGGFTGGS